MDNSMKRVIHIKHLIASMLKKWFVLLIAALAGSVLFAMIGAVEIKSEQKKNEEAPDMIEKRVSVNETQFLNVKIIAEYEDALKAQSTYRDSSILMEIDPLHRWICSSSYTVTAADEQQPLSDSPSIVNRYIAELEQQEIFDEICSRLGDGTEPAMLREVVKYEVSAEGSITITVSHVTQEKAKECSEIIAQCLAEKTASMQDVEAHKLVIEQNEPGEYSDMELVTYQTAMNDSIARLQDDIAKRKEYLSKKEKNYLEFYREERVREGYTEGAEIVKMVENNKKEITLSFAALKGKIAKGAMAGIVLAGCILSALYIFSKTLLNPLSVEDMFALRLLNEKDTKREVSEQLENIVGKVAVNLQDKEAGILITGSVMDEKTNKLAEELAKKLRAYSENVVVSESLLKNPSEILKLKEMGHVILLEKLNETKLADLQAQKELCSNSGKEIAGVVVI